MADDKIPPPLSGGAVPQRPLDATADLGGRHYRGKGLGSTAGWNCPTCGTMNAGEIGTPCINAQCLTNVPTQVVPPRIAADLEVARETRRLMQHDPHVPHARRILPQAPTAPSLSLGEIRRVVAEEVARGVNVALVQMAATRMEIQLANDPAWRFVMAAGIEAVLDALQQNPALGASVPPAQDLAAVLADLQRADQPQEPS